MITWKSSLLAMIAAHGAVAATPQTTTVEFFNTDLQHYFVTADAVEALAVDGGAAGPGWVRTGRAFGVWTDTGAAPAGAVPVCRFYSSGSHSHFYTADAAECAQLRSLQSTQSASAPVARKAAFTGWAYEGNAFVALVPTAGQCAAGTEPVNRFYNSGAATGTGSSHRFVTDADMAAMMQSRGWVAEGVAFCTPVAASGTSAPATPTAGSFPELAATWTGNGHWDFEAKPTGPEGESAAPVSMTIATDGTLTGTGAGCAIAGSITTGDGFHSLYTGTVTTTGCTEPHFDGTFPLRLERLGAAMLGMQFGSSTATLNVEVEAQLSSSTPPPPPPLPTSTGPTTYVGTVAWIVTQRIGTADGAAVSAANLPLTLTLDGTTLSGSGNGCTFAGTVQGSGEEMTATVTATGCTDAAFNGTYDHAQLGREDGAALEVEFDKETQSGQTTTHALIRGAIVVQGSGGTPPPQPPQPPSQPISGDWTGDAHWLAVQQQSGSSSTLVTETKPLSLSIASGGALTGSGFGCSFTGTLAQVEHALTGAVTATGCTNAAFNGTYASVELELEDGGALAVAMKLQAGGVRVSIIGVLATGSGGTTTPPPPPPPPSAFVLAGTWSAGNAEWQDARRQSGETTESESTHALTLTIASDGSVTGSGFGCAFTGSLAPVAGSTTAFTGPLSATGCTNDDFNGTYSLFGAHRSDDGKLEVGMESSSTSATLTVHVSVEAEMTKQ